MNNLNENYLELLRSNNKQTLFNNEEANMVFEAISEFISKDQLESFIKYDLCVFRTKEDVFNWFYDSENDGVITKDVVDMKIDDTMFGKTLMEVLLENEDGYMKVSDNIYIGYSV